MLNFLQQLWQGSKRRATPFRFDRPLLLIHSDDWGRVGTRDREGCEQLAHSGIQLGEKPYDFYTLETAEDVIALEQMLGRHRDGTGRAACVVMNFVMANLDFRRMGQSAYDRLSLVPLDQGLPGKWERPGLFEAYRHGIGSGVFFPALHGLTHFCQAAVQQSLTDDRERAELLRVFWQAETPYIYWRMPWIGYEYCNPRLGPRGYLPVETQDRLVREAAEIFRRFFGANPFSACAPGYRANDDTHAAWSRNGIRVIQSGQAAAAPFMNELDILNLPRSIDFEPSLPYFSVQECLRAAEQCFARETPAIVSVHSINFHSTLRNFRDTTLKALDEFISELQAKYPGLLFAHDRDLYDLVVEGKFESAHGPVGVNVTTTGRPRRRVAV
jgi:hypothetical protein